MARKNIKLLENSEGSGNFYIDFFVKACEVRKIREGDTK